MVKTKKSIEPDLGSIQHPRIEECAAYHEDDCAKRECSDECFVSKEMVTSKPEAVSSDEIPEVEKEDGWLGTDDEDVIRELPIHPGGYMEQYKTAKKAGKVSPVTHQIHSWQSDGDFLVGKVMGISPFTEGKFETEVNAYLIKTDEGLRSTVLGSYTDAQLKDRAILNCVVAITYNGQKQIEGGRKVNIFDIEVLSEA